MRQKGISAEFICIDDGSSDDSLSICEYYRSKDERFRVISSEHKGVSSARNIGLNACTGEYVCFLDSDDRLCRGALNTLYQNAKRTNCDTIKFNAKIVHGEEWMYELIKDHNDELITDFQQNDIFVYNNCRPFVWMHFIRRELLDGVRFDESLEIGEDQVFIIRYMMKCSRVLFLKEKLYVHYNRSDSSLGSVAAERRKMCDNHIRIVQSVLSFYGDRSCEFSEWVFDILYGYCPCDEGLDLKELMVIKAIFEEMSIIDYLIDDYRLRIVKTIMNGKVWIWKDD
jgi:glycosyltransferase involved in cell wall biosynthesis